jgi:hypothetical protein
LSQTIQGRLSTPFGQNSESGRDSIGQNQTLAFTGHAIPEEMYTLVLATPKPFAVKKSLAITAQQTLPVAVKLDSRTLRAGPASRPPHRMLFPGIDGDQNSLYWTECHQAI